MTIGLQSFSPVLTGGSSTQQGQTAETSNDETTTQGSGSSAASGESTTTEQSTSASSANQAEAKPSNVVQSVDTDVSVKQQGRTDAGQSQAAPELAEASARQLAESAQAKSVVEALIASIASPVEALELSGPEANKLDQAAEDTDDANQIASSDQSRTQQFEEGLSAVRGDS